MRLTPLALLSVKGLKKSYGGHLAVAGIDLDLAPGECFGLLGPNGAGKTTTLRLALGLTQPDNGTISLLDFAVPAHAREARARVGVVPQLDNLDPDFTLRENLLVYGRYFGIARDTLEKRIPDLLEYAGLAQRGDARIQALSGGMKRRLTLARALINDPDLLFLDEPTTGLDPQARHVIWERLSQLTLRGKTLLASEAAAAMRYPEKVIETAMDGQFKMLSDDGVFNPDEVTFAPGTFIPKSPEGKIEPLQSGAQFNISDLVLTDQRTNIKKALHVDEYESPGDTPYSAFEVQQRREQGGPDDAQQPAGARQHEAPLRVEGHGAARRQRVACDRARE